LLLLGALLLGVNGRESVEAFRTRTPRAVFLAWCAWAAVSIASLAWSLDVRYSRGELNAELLYGFAAFALYLVAATPRHVQPWLAALAAGTLLACTGAVIQPWLPAWLSRHPIDGGPGYLSTHVVLVAPALIAWALFAHGKRARAGWAVTIVATLAFAAWHTENRIVWVAFATQIVVAFLAWRQTQRRHLLATPAAGALVLFAIVALGAAFAASVSEREERLATAPGHEGSIEGDLRPRIWEHAFERVREAPWLGHGFGREILASDFAPLTPTGMPHPEIRHAHNMFIDVALELGLAGLAIFSVLLLALAREYLRMLKDPQVCMPGIVGLATLAGFVAKNMTDDFFHRHNALVFWMLQGALLGLAGARRKPLAA
jgi:O-antigen ligase